MITFLSYLFILVVGYFIGVLGSILHVQNSFKSNKPLKLQDGDYRLTKVK